MDETKLYEAMGRKQATIEAQDAAYGKLLELLAMVVSGAVELNRIAVNLTDRSWELASPGAKPNMPATINGLPVVVTAPEQNTPGE